MDIEEFCIEANKHKLLKGKYLKITPEILEKILFPIKKQYKESDFLSLNSALQKSGLKTKEKINNDLTARETRAKKSLLKALIPHIYSYQNSTNRKSDSLVSMYMIIPSVREWIDSMRNKYKIDPVLFRKEILYKFPREDWRIIYNLFGGENKRSSRRSLAYKALLKSGRCSQKEEKEYKNREEYIRNKKKMAEKLIGLSFEKDNFSNFQIDTATYCSKILKLPSEYYGYFRIFILFDEIDVLDDLANNSFIKCPEAEFVLEPSLIRYYYEQEKIENFEPHIKIKIYGNTTKEELKNMIDTLYEKDFIMKLPAQNYQSSVSRITRAYPKALYDKLLALFLVEKENLTHKETSNVLKSINVKINENNISRDIKRLKEALKI